MSLDEARVLANLNCRAQHLFRDGYRAKWLNDMTIAVTSPSGEVYQIDIVWQRCSCPYFEKTGGKYGCKHQMGYERLLHEQDRQREQERNNDMATTETTDTTPAAAQELFPLGQAAITVKAAAALLARGMRAETMLDRHHRGNWGTVDAEDKQSNHQALKWGGRLISTYALGDGREVWVITEADRSLTTIMMPEDY